MRATNVEVLVHVDTYILAFITRRDVVSATVRILALANSCEYWLVFADKSISGQIIRFFDLVGTYNTYS